MVMGDIVLDTEVLVIGSGPGGYAAAFKAADLGQDVVMVDPKDELGGTCLHEGCIPSKTCLQLAELIHDARCAAEKGVSFNAPHIDLSQVRGWKQGVVETMSSGLRSLSNQRGIELIKGFAVFENSETARIENSEIRRIQFRHAIIATGSHPISLPGNESTSQGRIMDSTGALQLVDIPQSLLVIGGGYIGLEIGMLYAALGTNVHLIEQQKTLLAGVDEDLVVPLLRRLRNDFSSIQFATSVQTLEEHSDHVTAQIADGSSPRSEQFDRVLVAIGRKPNSVGIGLTQLNVTRDEGGFVTVDEQQRTSVPNIFAVGDITGGMMLAHTATREGKIAAEVVSGMPSAFDARAVPAVVYTDPQIAWCGITEHQARMDGIEVAVHKFPWKYSGRAHTAGATEGFTKILTDPGDGRIVGVGITGRHAENLIAEGIMAIEMGALAEDMALLLHPHPTLSETEGEAAELFLGHATHFMKK